jgi:ketosteroid isomerase-like protein
MSGGKSIGWSRSQLRKFWGTRPVSACKRTETEVQQPLRQAQRRAPLAGESDPERDTAPAMSQPNVALIRRMYETFYRGDFDGALAYFDPEVEVDASMRVGEGISHGRDAVYAMVARWVGAWDEWREEIEEIRDLGRQVLVVSKQHGRAKGTGIEVETHYAVLYEIRGEKITRMTIYSEAAEALEAAGLTE